MVTEPDMPDRQWYDAFYTAARRSKAYSRYCEAVFGRDFSQQGFSDIAQIDSMLAALSIAPGECVLDIGCGCGGMLEYVCDATGATGCGLDFSAVAIQSARERTAGEADRLFYEVGDLGAKQYEPESVDVVMSVDTLCFADVGATVADVWRWLKPQGRLAAFFSEFRFSETDPLGKLAPHGTELARVLQASDIGYDVHDFTGSHYEHMRLKRRVIAGMKPEFEAEGTMVLFDNAFRESIEDAMTWAEFVAFSSRYLYVARKP